MFIFGRTIPCRRASVPGASTTRRLCRMSRASRALASLSVKELKTALRRRGVTGARAAVEKSELVALLTQACGRADMARVRAVIVSDVM